MIIPLSLITYFIMPTSGREHILWLVPPVLLLKEDIKNIFVIWNSDLHFSLRKLKFCFHQDLWLILLISCRSLFRLSSVHLGTLTVENRDLSSANNLRLHWRLSNESLMYFKNKSGPNIEAWPTPALILAQDELWPLIIILCFVFLNGFPEILLLLSLWIIPSCYTLSKPFQMSRNTPLTFWLSPKLENISLVMVNNWLIQESLCLNSDWFSDIRFFSVKYLNIILQIIPSKTLLQIARRETGV